MRSCNIMNEYFCRFKKNEKEEIVLAHTVLTNIDSLKL